MGQADGILKAIDRARANNNNPAIDPVFEALSAKYQAAGATLDDEMARYARTTGKKPGERQLAEIQDRYTSNITAELTQQFGHDEAGRNAVKTAMDAMIYEAKPVGGMFSPLLKPFLDDKGGPKLGGIIGGIIGLIGAFITSKGGDFGYLGLAALPLGAGLGAWAGNKIMDMINPPKPEFTPETPVVALSSVREYELGATKSPELGALPSPMTAPQKSPVGQTRPLAR